jgi:DNA-binding transcriptional MerR regulator
VDDADLHDAHDAHDGQGGHDGHDGDRATGLLPIGMFSRASSLSIKTLRAYHEGGILVPARIDPRTGYRSYTADQLADAAVVSRLRALDLPLEQGRRVLVARDPDLTARVLAQHRVEMEARLADAERIVAELQAGLAPVTHTPIHVRFEQAADSIRIVETVPAADLWEWLDDAFDRLLACLDEIGQPAVGPPSALYEPQLADEEVEHVEAFVAVAAPVVVASPGLGITIGEVPAAWSAVLVHTGDLDSIGDTYRTLGAWVARHAAPAGERIRERYVVGRREGAAVDAYRTEISWPIVRSPGSATSRRPGANTITITGGDKR